MRCADCGKPVHPSDETCAECGGVQVYCHDEAADSMACLGSGPHVKAEPGPMVLARVRDGLPAVLSNSSSVGEAA